MTSQNSEDIIDEINALRNDFYEDGGIVDELKKIRELLESINWMVKQKCFPAAKSELGEFLENRIKEAADGKQ